MADVYTYNPLQVKIALGNHVVTGVAEDSFVTIEANGDGTTLKVGCYGEVNRAISVNKAFNVRIVLLQNSPTNQFLRDRYQQDQQDGTGVFPILIKDIMGNEKFSGDYCWVTNESAWGRGRETTNREWQLVVAEGRASDL